MNSPCLAQPPARVCARGILIILLLLRCAVIAEDSPSGRRPQERAGTATIIHRAEVIHESGTNAADRAHLWPLYSTPEVRMNYFEVTGRGDLHFHPDADHRLYVLEGKVVVTAGTNTTTAT